MNMSLPSMPREDGVCHLRRASDVDALDRRGCRHRRRAADDRHLGAGLGRRPREREAHLARARIGDAAHGVDRLERRPGGRAARACRRGLSAAATRSVAANRSPASSIRPSPFSLHASSPVSGPSTITPSATMRATLRCVAALAHIWRFIAGATSKGHSRARHSVDRRSSAAPWASLAMKSAVAGATTMASAPRETAM